MRIFFVRRSIVGLFHLGTFFFDQFYLALGWVSRRYRNLGIFLDLI